MRSFLARFQPVSPLSDDELYAKKKNGWHDDKTLVVTLEQRNKLKNKHIDAIQEIGSILYGDSKK